MDKLHMKIGQNIGEILLDIAQTAIQDGNPDKAVRIYTDSLHGFTEEYVIKLLKNEYVLIASKDGTSVELTDDEKEKTANQSNITDWNSWTENQLVYLIDTVNALSGIRKGFEKCCVKESILDCNIKDLVTDYFGSTCLAENVGVHNIAAKLIAGEGFSSLFSNGENVWDDLCSRVETGDSEKYQEALYLIVKYVDCIRCLHKHYMNFVNAYTFLVENKLAERPQFLEARIEAVLSRLKEFADTTEGYYHPMCNTKLFGYKESLLGDILSTEYGKEYCRYGTIEKNIMDGYDAGWLSPEGKYYGDSGPTSSMIHVTIAEKLNGGDWDGDRRLEEKGWLKIHHDEVYGAFNDYDSNSYQYCPTKTQVKTVCKYIDKHYHGLLYTHPKIIKSTEPVSTFKLRQMDKVMLHGLFSY